jgi:hypothetical protein
MLSRSIVSEHFMEPEGSIPNSQELSTCSYPEPDQSSPHQSSRSKDKPSKKPETKFRTHAGSHTEL